MYRIWFLLSAVLLLLVLGCVPATGAHPAPSPAPAPSMPAGN
ncbi:hypothetical protein [Streptomyces fuscichromogenes]|nr:hypothetical protein [Streptomyces fuscichromogenes]